MTAAQLAFLSWLVADFWCWALRHSQLSRSSLTIRRLKWLLILLLEECQEGESAT